MKGQSQIVSVVIIVMIALGAIALVLPWTFSMIQKKKDMKTLDDVHNFFQTLNEAIINIARTGGEESLRLEVPGGMTVYPESSDSYLNNSIVFSFQSLVSNIAEGDWIPLNTPNINETATLVDPPSVIFGKANKTDNTLEIQYRLWYRELEDTSGYGYKIVLNTTDNTEKSTTVGFLRIQRLGSRDIPAKSLTITEINIIV